MGKAVAMHGADARTIEAMAKIYARAGKAISKRDLSVKFMLDFETISRIVDEPAFIALVQNKAFAILNRDGVSAALDLLVRVARDEKANLGHRLRAVELILSRTVPAATADSASGETRDLTELSAEELYGLVDHLQGELARRAKPVASPASIDAVSVNPSDPFD